MKKILLMAMIFLLGVGLCACKDNGPLRAIEGATEEQIASIQKTLNEYDIVVQSCEKVTEEMIAADSENDASKEMALSLMKTYIPYTIISVDNKEYRLTLKKDTMEVFSIVDDQGKTLYGFLADSLSAEDDANAESIAGDPQPEEEGITELTLETPTIVPDVCEFTIHKISYTYDVLPDSMDIVYTHYQAEQGKIYLEIDISVKNLQKKALACDEIAEITLDYNDGYIYEAFPIVEDAQTGFTYANISAIDPLETKEMRYLVDCPIELYTEINPQFLTLQFGEHAYQIQLVENGRNTGALSTTPVNLSDEQLAIIQNDFSLAGLEVKKYEIAPPFYDSPDPNDQKANEMMHDCIILYVHTTDGTIYSTAFSIKYNFTIAAFNYNTQKYVISNFEKLAEVYLGSQSGSIAPAPTPAPKKPVDMSKEDIVSLYDVSTGEYIINK